MSGYLEVVEGPDAGRQLQLDRVITIGRDQSADFVLSDERSSRRHCQITPRNGTAVVEDLKSRNGTFVNNQQVVDTAELGPGDDLLVGVTVLELRGLDPATERQSGVRVVPDALRVPERTPDYVPEPVAAVAEPAPPDPNEKLKAYLDVRVKRRTRLAPLILLALAVVVVVVFALTEGIGSVPDFEIIWNPEG